MEIKEISDASEDALLREGETLGDVLGQLRDRIPPALIDGPDWERLVEHARGFSATAAAFPVGFEIPLDDPLPRADWGFSVLGGSRTADAIREEGQAEDADPAVAGIARLLAEMKREDSELGRITDREMSLEYDMDVARYGGAIPGPGFFFGTIGRPLFGDGASQRFADLDTLIDGVAMGTGWNVEPAERREIERVYRAIPPDIRMESFGVFPARGRFIRLQTRGFRKTSDLTAFLGRTGWSGQRSAVASMGSRFEERGAFHNLSAYLDVLPDGVGPVFGLNMHRSDERPQDGRYWLDRPGNWVATIDGLREEGLALPEKLSALAGWPSVEMLFGRTGMFVFVRGIHHVKLVMKKDDFEQAKAYLYLFMRTMPREGSPAG